MSITLSAFTQTQSAVLAFSLAACWFDLRTRRIPNVLTFGGALCGLSWALVHSGPSGLALSALGWATGAALFFPLFALGGMGAGDVKLLACCGAWLGPVATAWVALYASLAGGVMAVAVSVATGYLAQAIVNTQMLIWFWRTSGIQPLPALTLSEGRGPRLPYAVPIAVGVLTAVWWP